jgi:hypothetical protein
MPILWITEGWGVCAHLNKYELYSNGFVDCSPIVMYNEVTHRCGLFHFFAGYKEYLDDQSPNLKDMAADVKPTRIDIYKGEDQNGKPQPEARRVADGKALEKFFKELVPTAKVSNHPEHTGQVHVKLVHGKLDIGMGAVPQNQLVEVKSEPPKDNAVTVFNDDWLD